MANQVSGACRCGVDHWRTMLNALTTIFDYTGSDIQATKNTAYRAIPNTECQSPPDAATRMRDLCVVHLRATADALDVKQETEYPNGTAFIEEAKLRRRIASELQSLTLDQAEKKQ